MEYIITNGKISICLDEKGRPVTCGKKEAHSFNKEKAENILNNLPSVLKNFHFKIRCVSPGGSKKDTKMNVTITKLMIVKVKKQYYMVKIMNRAKK